jgi:hypothetical protein
LTVDHGFTPKDTGFSASDVQYALETTRILAEPDRRIETFGTTQFEFVLISELMDSVGQIRIRSGKIQAERPMLLRPEPYTELSFEGFGSGADAFESWLKEQVAGMAIVRYGFNFKKSDVTESIVHDDLLTVQDRVLAENKTGNHPSRAIIFGVDDTWEICLLKFTVDLIRRSAETNTFDFKRRGLL